MVIRAELEAQLLYSVLRFGHVYKGESDFFVKTYRENSLISYRVSMRAMMSKTNMAYALPVYMTRDFVLVWNSRSGETTGLNSRRYDSFRYDIFLWYHLNESRATRGNRIKLAAPAQPRKARKFRHLIKWDLLRDEHLICQVLHIFWEKSTYLFLVCILCSCRCQVHVYWKRWMNFFPALANETEPSSTKE